MRNDGRGGINPEPSPRRHCLVKVLVYQRGAFLEELPKICKRREDLKVVLVDCTSKAVLLGLRELCEIEDTVTVAALLRLVSTSNASVGILAAIAHHFSTETFARLLPFTRTAKVTSALLHSELQPRAHDRAAYTHRSPAADQHSRTPQ